MELSAVWHEMKSAYSYPSGTDTIHLRVRTKKNDIKGITAMAVDPYYLDKDKKGNSRFISEKIKTTKMALDYSTALHDYWFTEISGFIHHRIRYGFILYDDTSRYYMGSRRFIPLTEETEYLDTENSYIYPTMLEEDIYKAPDWVKDTIWYQVFPDRFARSTDGNKSEEFPKWDYYGDDEILKKFGGNLRGIIEKLDHISDLGCTGIYMTPIFESPSHHRYDTSDYLKLDPIFGSEEELTELIEKAHDRGMRVMLDAVFNHCGSTHPFWLDVLEKGEQSEYYDCFYILDKEKPIKYNRIKDQLPGEGLNYLTFAYYAGMPKWNTSNKIAREYLLNTASYWTEKYNIDGWRLDVANEVSHDFWREFKKRITAIRSDIYILGENWHYSYPWIMGDQFHAVMNYEFTVPVTEFFSNKYTAEEFADAISLLLVSYPKITAPYLFNLIDSHDTDRIVTICGDNKQKAQLAYLFMLTFTGCPCIYYGGEYALTGDITYNRRPMPWDGDKDLEMYKVIKRLIEIRKENPEAKSVDVNWIYAKEGALIYEKPFGFYVIMNNSDKECTVNIPDKLKGSVKDLYTGETLLLDEEIAMKPYSFKIYRK